MTNNKKEKEQITITVIHNCNDCQDVGAIASNAPDGSPEVQRCDSCQVYGTDAEPQAYFEINKNFDLKVKPGVHLIKYPNSKKWILKREVY